MAETPLKVMAFRLSRTSKNGILVDLACSEALGAEAFLDLGQTITIGWRRGLLESSI